MKLISYLRFLLKSTNHHGVHSPFVFDYLTKCLYRPKISENKTEDVLLKSIAYFGFKNVKLDDLEKKKSDLNARFPYIEFTKTPYDFVYLNTDQKIELPFHDLYNDSMVLIDNIHHSKNRYKNWLLFIEKTQITVSIDFYHCGVVFVRKEQVKEHFKIRI